MLSPTDKSPYMEHIFKKTFGISREQSILDEMCVPAPIGCGKPVTKFTDEISAKEYCISGLCQECQDKLFDTPPGTPFMKGEE